MSAVTFGGRANGRKRSSELMTEVQRLRRLATRRELHREPETANSHVGTSHLAVSLLSLQVAR